MGSVASTPLHCTGAEGGAGTRTRDLSRGSARLPFSPRSAYPILAWGYSVMGLLPGVIKPSGSPQIYLKPSSAPREDFCPEWGKGAEPMTVPPIPPPTPTSALPTLFLSQKTFSDFRILPGTSIPAGLYSCPSWMAFPLPLSRSSVQNVCRECDCGRGIKKKKHTPLIFSKYYFVPLTPMAYILLDLRAWSWTITCPPRCSLTTGAERRA